MKLIASCLKKLAVQMPPTRGHDLKPYPALSSSGMAWMPPTRGHDLKLKADYIVIFYIRMPPTRGHDLKLLMNVKTAATS